MGHNVKKCTLYLYIIPQHTNVSIFTSTAWSFDAQGPTTGNIATVIMYRDADENLICYDISKTIRNEVQQNIKDIITDRKYLGIPTNAQLDSMEGKEKLVNKLKERIAIISKNTNCIKEVRILHNTLPDHHQDM